MKKKCLFSIILTIVLLFSGIIVCFATDASQPEMATVKLNICGVTVQNASIDVHIKNVETNNEYTLSFNDKENWSTTFNIPQGSYEVTKIKKTSGEPKFSLQKNRGTLFVTSGMGVTEVNLYVSQTHSAFKPIQFLKDNVITLLAILGCCVGLFVVKKRREIGEG